MLETNNGPSVNNPKMLPINATAQDFLFTAITPPRIAITANTKIIVKQTMRRLAIPPYPETEVFPDDTKNISAIIFPTASIPAIISRTPAANAVFVFFFSGYHAGGDGYGGYGGYGGCCAGYGTCGGCGAYGEYGVEETGGKY